MDEKNKTEKEKDSSKKNQNANMTKDDLHEVVSKALDHENVSKIVGMIDKYIDHAHSKKRRKNVINMIYVVAALLGFYLAWDATLNQISAARINDDIKVQKAEIKKITSAMMNLRKVRYLIVLNCKYSHSYSQFDQDKMRFLARNELVETGTAMRFDFSSEIQEKINALIEFDESVKNVCAQDAPSDLAWRKHVQQIEQLMGNAVNKNKKRLYELSKKWPD